MNGGTDKRKKRRKKQGREKREKVGKRRREEKRDRTRSKSRERELCRILPKPRVCKLVPFSGHQHTDNRVLDSLLSTNPRRKTGALACLFSNTRGLDSYSIFLTPQKRNTLLPKADKGFIL